MISTPEVSRRANIQNLEGVLSYQFQTMFTPLLWALGKDLVQGGQRQNTIDQMQLWGFILSTPTIASDKYYRNWNVWGQTDTILANY